MILQEEAKAHIVFDCDGTLIDSMKPFFDILFEILPKHLGRTVSKDEIHEAFTPEWVGLLQNLGVEQPSKELLDGLIADTSAINLRNPVPPLYPNIKQCLQELEELGFATYVWTGRDRASSLRILKDHGIIQHFTQMQFSDTSIPKPHPDGLEIMLQDFPKNKIGLIGDSSVDIQGAKNFEIPCLVVDWHKNINHAEYLDFGATQIITETSEIITWAKSL